MATSNLFLKKIGLISLFFVISLKTNAQNNTEFWSKVRYGGAVGLDFGAGYFSAMLAPSAIYQFNPMVAAGVGVQYSYINVKSLYSTNLYGASIIGLFNPIDNIQLSAELEETFISTTFKLPVYTDSYWTTALYLGAGYYSNGVTVGVRYNALYNPDKSLYKTAFLPFIRVYF